MPTYTYQNLLEMCTQSLLRAGISDVMARDTAEALVLAEAQGIVTHGLSRISQYKGHINNERVNVEASPKILKDAGSATLIDAEYGLAFSACKLAIKMAVEKAKTFGISISSVTNSHHAGVMVDHLRPLIPHSFVGLSFSNVSAVMPVPNGKKPILGTNPIAAIFPREEGKSPLMIDMGLSEVTRGQVAKYQSENKEIPLGWALDKDGNPTTSAKEAMNGFMMPFGSSGGSKGAVLALLVELLTSVIVGSAFSYEASSFFKDEGNKPRIGQTFIVINPDFLAGKTSYLSRLEEFISEMHLDEGVRIPGERREEKLKYSLENGIEISDASLKLLMD